MIDRLAGNVGAKGWWLSPVDRSDRLSENQLNLLLQGGPMPPLFTTRTAAVGAAALAGFAAVAGASAASSRPGAAAAASPPQTVTASAITTTPGTLSPGTRVRARNLGTRVFPDARHGFALAGVGQAQYPAATTNGGRSWRTDGPALHLDAAQAPLAVVEAGAANRRTFFAYGGGQVVDSTNDGGRHWWRAVLGDVVMAVATPGNGRLVAFAQVPTTPNGTRAATWVYVSTDGGHHWHYNGREGAF